MYFISCVVLCLACLAANVLAAPTAQLYQPAPVNKRSFKVARPERLGRRNGPAELRRAYQKYGLTSAALPAIDFNGLAFSHLHHTFPDANTQAAAATDETGQVVTNPTPGDTEFLTAVTVGGQKLTMDFDTGSSDMWVFNTQLAAATTQGHGVFDPTKSSTFATMSGATFDITYGDSSFSRGTVGTDDVDIGGVTVTKQAIGLPTSVAASFASDTASDGLVGLAFSKLNTIQPQQQKTFFANAMNNLALPLFSANLKKDAAGSYEFGKIDTTAFKGNLANVSVDASNGFWQFDSPQFQVGNGAVQANNGSGIAIADTGTTLMLVDDAVVNAYYAQVTGAQFDAQSGGVVFPCNAALPDLSVAFGANHMATIPGNLNNFTEIGTDTTTGQAFCFGGIQSSQGSQFQIYGDVMFQSQFVVFDGATPSLGIAPHA